MSHRAVYDTMVFFQWAVLPSDRQHRTVQSLYDGSIRICLSPALVGEVRDVLSRAELQTRFPALTPLRVELVLEEATYHADWFDDVPPAFTWLRHPDDDHIFNLAIAAQARFLVTWENRIHHLASERSADADQLRSLAPGLEIVSPATLAQRLAAERGERSDPAEP